jgi:hypothetical protein
MADTQDVIIVGVEGGVTAWSTESTQKSIADGIKQTTAQNAAIIALLRLVAKGEAASKDQLNAIKVEIGKQSKATTVTNRTNKDNAQRQSQAEGKNSSVWNAFLNLQKINTGQLKTNDRNAAARQSKIEQLMKLGSTKDSATKSVDKDETMEKYKKIGAKAIITAGGIKAAIDTIKAAVQQGFTERFDMAGDMRQSGLMAGVDKAEQGFVSISRMITETGFTFGEAAEFTKRFSKAVGVTGVKSALDFATSVADVGNQEGMMQRFSMEFGQVVNMSGQYLESLRLSGQLQTRDKQELKTGMESFMSNVQMTSNVLKISMEEAAELMQKSVSPDQAGLLATLPKEMRMAAENALKAMNVQGGPMGEALAARLAAGSEQAFLQTDEYQNLAGTGVGQELLSFINQIAPTVTAGGSEEELQNALATEMPKFAERIQGFASQDGVRVQLLGNKQLAGLVGQILESAQTYGDADAGIYRGGREDTARMLATEQTRKATNLAEKSLTELMPSFVDSLIKLTKTNQEFAEAASASIIHQKGKIGTAVDASVFLEDVSTSIVTGLIEAVFGPGTNTETESNLGTNGMSETAYKALATQEYTGTGSTITPLLSHADKTSAHKQQLELNTQEFMSNSNGTFGGDVAKQEKFYDDLIRQLAVMKDMQGDESNYYASAEWRQQLDDSMAAQAALIAQMKILNNQLIE